MDNTTQSQPQNQKKKPPLSTSRSRATSRGTVTHPVKINGIQIDCVSQRQSIETPKLPEFTET